VIRIEQRDDQDVRHARRRRHARELDVVYASLVLAMLMARRGLLRIHLGAGHLSVIAQSACVHALAQTRTDVSREADLRKQKRK